MKKDRKRQAIELRLQGHSYSEILKQVPVAKSTLSDWLKAIGLAKQQKQRLTQKKLDGMKRGSEARKNIRIQKTQDIVQRAKEDIQKLPVDNMAALMLLGTMLYWAEGAKQKEHNVSQRVIFSNSDPQMVKIFLIWLGRICKVPSQEIKFELYIHEKSDIAPAVQYWKDTLKIDTLSIRLKKHIVTTKRKNIGKTYHGLCRVTVKRSTDLNRRITGWIQGICEQCGVV